MRLGAWFMRPNASCEQLKVVNSSGMQPLCDRLSLRRPAGGRALVVLASSQAVGLTVVRGRSEPRGSTNRPSRPSVVLSRTRKSTAKGAVGFRATPPASLGVGVLR